MKRDLMILLVLVLPISVLAQYKESKTIDRNYNVTGKGSLTINGKYGNIHIDTWDAKSVEVKVKIEAKKRTAELARKMVEKVKIVIDDSNKEALSFRTNIDGSINNRSGEQLKIEYWVKAPKELSFKLKNSYGNMYLANNEGKNVLNVAYGNIKVDQCKGNTQLDLSYGNGEVESIYKGTLNLSYTNLSLGSVSIATVSSNYSNLDATKIGELNLENRYGNLNIGTIDVLKGYSKYGAVDIEKLNDLLEFKLLHSGGLSVDWVSKNFEKINLEAKYGSVSLKMENGFGANLDAEMTYCSLKYGDIPFDYSHLKEEAQYKVYKGVLGSKQNAGNRIISIVSSYGNVKIYYAD